MISPQQGLAVVHHNTDFDGNVDYAAVYGENLLRVDGTVKYIARKFVYSQPLPPSKRLLLPLLAYPFGGKLPRWVIGVYDLLLVKFGVEQGTVYFDKLCSLYPVFLLFVIGMMIQRLFQHQLSALENGSEKSKKEKAKKPSSKKSSKKGKKED